MNIKIVKNRYLNALLVLMLFSAIVHMLVIFFLVIISGNLHFLNYFNIVSLNYFIPNFSNDLSGNIISFAFMLIIYLAILKSNKIQ